jgi:hypothetical protein
MSEKLESADEAFEKWRVGKFSAYAGYPIEAYTYFCAGFDAARSTALPQTLKVRVSNLTKLAAECHRRKWQFDLSEEYQPSKAAARALITKAFQELHRVGDLALEMRAALSDDKGAGK